MLKSKDFFDARKRRIPLKEFNKKKIKKLFEKPDLKIGTSCIEDSYSAERRGLAIKSFRFFLYIGTTEIRNQ